CRRRVDSRKAQPLPGQLEFVFAPNAGPQPVRRFGALLSPRVPPLRTKYEKQSQAYEKNDENNRSETPSLEAYKVMTEKLLPKIKDGKGLEKWSFVQELYKSKNLE